MNLVPSHSNTEKGNLAMFRRPTISQNDHVETCHTEPRRLFRQPNPRKAQQQQQQQQQQSVRSSVAWYLMGINALIMMATLVLWLEFTSSRTTSSTQGFSSILQKSVLQGEDKASPIHANASSSSALVVTQFDEHCYMLDKPGSKKKDRKKTQETNVHRHLADSQDVEQEETAGVGRPDKHKLGRCVAEYPQRKPPSKGYLQDIDWYHLRQEHDWREACYVYCLSQLPAEYWQQIQTGKDDKTIDASNQAVLLNQAVVMGLPRVVDILKNQYNMDPLQTIHHSANVLTENKSDSYELNGSNAVQQAIRMGNAQILAILTDSNLNLQIDHLGRTVMDYMSMKGSPIRPRDAKQYLNVDTTNTQMAQGIRGQIPQQPAVSKEDDAFFRLLEQHPGMGWSELTRWPVSEKCDIDIVHGSMSRQEFYHDYFLPGRPFVLRGIIPKDEIAAFSRKTWERTRRYHPDRMFWVGPTAYPSLTGQEECEGKMSIRQLEAGEKCPEAPDTPILHAWHPTDQDFAELFPSYEDGDIYNKKSGWRKLGEWFFPEVEEMDGDLGWQIFFGGDESGATLHWHNAAFNVLYAGIKEWKITPPWYRGFTGMPAMKASGMVDDAIALSCTQRPGDFVYIPNYWGHLTLNHGFTIGAAVIMTNTYQQYADAKPRIHFVHINKAGGSSVIEMLRERCEPQFYEEEWDENGVTQRTFHATAHALMDHYGVDNWENSYRFAVVRHPLARVVSNFFFLVGRCRDARKDASGFVEKCKDRSVPWHDLSSKSVEEQVEAFHGYFHRLYERYPPGSPRHYLFGSLGHGNEVFETFNATQTSWLVDASGEIAVDHIFHLESLSTDLDALARDLPCLYDDESEEPEDVRKLLDMVHENPSEGYPDYRLFGRNERTNTILREVYGVDYENFGYEF